MHQIVLVGAAIVQQWMFFRNEMFYKFNIAYFSGTLRLKFYRSLNGMCSYTNCFCRHVQLGDFTEILYLFKMETADTQYLQAIVVY